ncbi:MAG TPA: cysteine hydrolase [Betaproteobacteria bacterium]|nr:cysteine hydrolase [Betaproteobacteria bacterium]
MSSLPQTLRQWANAPRLTAFAAAKTALLLIDFQMESFTGHLPLPEGEPAVNNAARLVAWADKHNLAVAHIQHIAASPASPLFTPGGAFTAFHPQVEPSSRHRVFTKGLPSAFVGAGLDEWLKTAGIDTVLITGLATHMCVDSTARDALSHGYRVLVVSDACASRDLPALGGGMIAHGEMHRAALAALADRFADVLDSAAVLALPVNA